MINFALIKMAGSFERQLQREQILLKRNSLLVPGQGPKLHPCISVHSPTQSLPWSLGEGLVQLRCRTWIPSPQEELHGPRGSVVSIRHASTVTKENLEERKRKLDFVFSNLIFGRTGRVLIYVVLFVRFHFLVITSVYTYLMIFFKTRFTWTGS